MFLEQKIQGVFLPKIIAALLGKAFLPKTTEESAQGVCRLSFSAFRVDFFIANYSPSAMRKVYTAVLLWLFGSCWLSAQVFNMTGAPIFSCTGMFFDTGGSAGDYPNGQSLHTTICPDGLGFSQVMLRFDALALAPGDTLCLRDGSTVFAPLIACFSDSLPSLPFEVKASAANGSGCLTVVFSSDAQGTAAGWSAAIACVPCVLPPPANVQVVQMRGGNMHWQWEDVPGSAGFEVRVNGGPWEPSSEPLGHVIGGLIPGDVTILEVRPISPNPNCTVQSALRGRAYVECMLSLSLASWSDARCSGTPSGTAIVVATGGIGPVNFGIVGNPAVFPDGNFVHFFPAGDHRVVAQDSAGCRDTVAFRIEEPPPIEIQLTMTDARCFADNSGSALAKASGGVGGFSFRWQRCQGGTVVPGPLATDLFAGCYAVTVTDANGCTAVAQGTIGEPSPFSFSSSQDSVSCHGGSDGWASISAGGSVPPYSYRWSNGDVGPVADSLKAGFHSVTVTDSRGCQAVTLVQVHQPPMLRFDSLEAVGVSCFGGSDGRVSAFGVGGSPPLSYFWNNQPGAPIWSSRPAGVYTVTVVDRKGCSLSASLTVNSPDPLLAQAVVQGETCVGACDGSASLTFVGGTPPYDIVWDTTGIPPGQNHPQRLCPGRYPFTLKDSRGCATTDSVVIAPALAITATFDIEPPRCAGGTDGAVEVKAQGGTPSYNYRWSNGQSGNVLVGLSCGVYSVTVEDGLGCEHVDSAVLLCPSPIVIDSMATVPASCFGGADGSATVFARGGTGALSFLWSDPNGQFAPVAVNLSAGTYTVTVSDANGCRVESVVAVGQPPALQAALFFRPVTCHGGSDGAVWVVVGGGTPPYAYQWNVPSGDSLLTDVSAGLYAATVTDAQGCAFSPPSVVVTQPPTALQVSAEVVRHACYNGAGGIARAEAIGGNGTPFTYSWSNNSQQRQVEDLSAGVYTVTVADALGCTAVQSVQVDRWDSLFASMVVIPPTCPNSMDGQASVNKIQGGAGNGIRENYRLQWNIPGVGDTIYVNRLSGGQLVSLTVTDNAGCTAVLARQVDTLPPIRPLLQVDSIRCFGQYDGAVRVVSVQSTRPIASYRWSAGVLGQSLQHLSPGTYTVTVTDTQGCTGTASATLTEPLPLQVALQVEPIKCTGDRNGQVRALPSGGTPPYSYNWSTGSSADVIADLGVGSYTLTLSDRNGCTRTDSVVLQAPDPIVLEVQTIPPTCFGFRNGRATVLAQGGALPLRFRLNGGFFGASPTFLGLSAGSYTATVLDGKGCQTEMAFQIDQPPPLQVSLSADTTIAFGDSLLLQADVFNAVGEVTLRWQSALADSLYCADPPECTAVWVVPPYSNTYTAVAGDANGCTGSASVRVQVEKLRGVYVPLAFSPNGDGQNDRLVVHGKSRQVRQVRLFRVYDRWGELVFEAAHFPPNDDTHGWDGSFRNRPAQAGTYVWYALVEYRDGYQEQLRGEVLLLR